MANLGKFSADWSKAVRKLDVIHDKIVQDIASDLFSAVIKNTPVETGQLVDHWSASVGAPNPILTGKEYSKKAKKKASRLAKTSEVITSVSTMTQKSTAYLVNTVVYGGEVEFGGVKNVPRGMIRRAVARLRSIVRKAINKNKI